MASCTIKIARLVLGFSIQSSAIRKSDQADTCSDASESALFIWSRPLIEIASVKFPLPEKCSSRSVQYQLGLSFNMVSTESVRSLRENLSHFLFPQYVCSAKVSSHFCIIVSGIFIESLLLKSWYKFILEKILCQHKKGGNLFPRLA